MQFFFWFPMILLGGMLRVAAGDAGEIAPNLADQMSQGTSKQRRVS